METKKLFCLIDGDPLRKAFPVKADPALTVIELKMAIHAEKSDRFQDIDPDDLELWKVALTADEIATLANLPQKLAPTRLELPLGVVGDYWTSEPPKQSINLIVALPLPEPAISHTGSSIKRSSSLGDPSFSAQSDEQPLRPTKKLKTEHSSAYSSFWAKWWERNNREPTFEKLTIQRDDTYPELILPERCDVMDGHEIIPDVSKVLIRSEYTEVSKQVESRCARRPTSGLIVVGDHGTGKTMLLFYLLACRLAEGRPTAFQLWHDTVLLFTKDGVQEFSVPAYPPPFDMWKLVEPGTWALSEPSEKVGTPSELLTCPGSPFFVIQATLPDASHWNWTRQKTFCNKFFIKPWTLEEIVIGRGLQGGPTPSELALSKFYCRYGPSTRYAYQITGPEDQNDYSSILKEAVAAFPEDSLHPTQTIGVTTTSRL